MVSDKTPFANGRTDDRGPHIGKALLTQSSRAKQTNKQTKKQTKRYSSYKLQPNIFKRLLNFLLNGLHKTKSGIFSNSNYAFRDFPRGIKFTIVPYGEPILVGHIWGIFDLTTIKVIFGSFGALAFFFRNYDFRKATSFTPMILLQTNLS